MKPWNEGPIPTLELHVMINGKKYILDSISTFSLNKVRLLKLGDYPARLTRDAHPNSYEFSQNYELLFPNGKTRKFVVIGQSE